MKEEAKKFKEEAGVKELAAKKERETAQVEMAKRDKEIAGLKKELEAWAKKGADNGKGVELAKAEAKKKEGELADLKARVLKEVEARQRAEKQAEENK